MLHIATVHFKSPRWIPIQMRELARNMTVAYRTWASFEGVDSSWYQYFDRVAEHSGGHAEKLNLLADEIGREAADEDLIMFLDGDAFPIADPVPLIAARLNEAPLMAVRRIENCEDPQPHPCFCVTHVETWKRLPGDWSDGMTWTLPEGVSITDVGANLMHRLEATGTPWSAVLRSNRCDLHPVFFGVYGGSVYHHGAGFRRPVSRADARRHLVETNAKPSSVDWSVALQEVAERNRLLSVRLFERIRRDDPHWLSELM